MTDNREFMQLVGIEFIGWNYGYAFLPRSGLLEQQRGADGVNIAVLRQGRAGLEFIRAAAHAGRYVSR